MLKPANSNNKYPIHTASDRTVKGEKHSLNSKVWYNSEILVYFPYLGDFYDLDQKFWKKTKKI